MVNSPILFFFLAVSHSSRALSYMPAQWATYPFQCFVSWVYGLTSCAARTQCTRQILFQTNVNVFRPTRPLRLAKKESPRKKAFQGEVLLKDIALLQDRCPLARWVTTLRWNPCSTFSVRPQLQLYLIRNHHNEVAPVAIAMCFTDPTSKTGRSGVESSRIISMACITHTCGHSCSFAAVAIIATTKNSI